jgi:hypothetical protein
MSRDNPAEAWDDVLHAYRMFANSVNGAWVAPMIEIVQKLAATRYATRLYPNTSHFRLFVKKAHAVTGAHLPCGLILTTHEGRKNVHNTHVL